MACTGAAKELSGTLFPRNSVAGLKIEALGYAIT